MAERNRRNIDTLSIWLETTRAQPKGSGMRRGMVAALLWIIGLIGAAEATTSSRPLPGLQPDGSVLLPNQWSLRPAGRQTPVGDFPVNVALHPAGRYAAVLHCGWGPHEIRILDVKSGRAISAASLPESFYGLAWSHDGKQLFASGAAAEVIHVFAFDDGYLSQHRELQLRSPTEQGIPAGLTASADGPALYVAESWGQRVEKVDVADGKIVWTAQLAPPQKSSETAPDEPRTAAWFNDAAPFPYTCVADEAHGRLYVSLWAKATVLVLNPANGAEIARWPVGDHPNEMALGADGRLFVAEANRNSVSVVDTRDGRVIESLIGSLFPNSPPGSMPNSVALSPDESLLFVANATNNDLAVFDVSNRAHAVSLGFVPVGWFPTSVRVSADGKTLIVANGKGLTSAANPQGPFPGDRRPQSLTEYVAALMRGTVSLIDLPEPEKRAAQFGAWSATAYACSPLQANLRPTGTAPSGNPIPDRVGGPSPIRHVIYIVRENRTYDQVFGDLPVGNGEPRLCLFGDKVTPNAHALAQQFVLLDNFFADGEISADGHEWTMGAFATDFVEKWWPLNYGHNKSKKYDYPAEGRYPVAVPANGYLWNRAAEAKISYRSYGEFTLYGNGTAAKPAYPALPVLRDHVDPLYPSWNVTIPDAIRADRFIAELNRLAATGDMPRLQVVQLPNDHTGGTKPLIRTPTAMVADNDYALGRIVEAVSHSRFWSDTAIFVLEDDAQNGPDHVDAHRMPALVISPWTKRRAVDSTLYSTTSMLRTIELILGLQPMSQYDAAAIPMWASFQNVPDPSAYAARPPQVDVHAVNSSLAWGARTSERMDFSAPDRVDDIVLNEVVWRSVRGANSPMPAPVRAAFFKAHPKTDDDGDEDD